MTLTSFQRKDHLDDNLPVQGSLIKKTTHQKFLVSGFIESNITLLVILNFYPPILL